MIDSARALGHDRIGGRWRGRVRRLLAFINCSFRKIVTGFRFLLIGVDVSLCNALCRFLLTNPRLYHELQILGGRNASSLLNPLPLCRWLI